MGILRKLFGTRQPQVTTPTGQEGTRAGLAGAETSARPATRADRRQIERLVQQLATFGGDKSQAVAECARFGSAAVPFLLSTLEKVKDSQPGRGVDLIRALGEIGDPQAVEPLIQIFLAHVWGSFGTGNLAPDAAEALGQIGDPRAVRPMLGVLRGEESLPDGAQLQAVVKALGRLGAVEAREDLEQLVAQSGKEGERGYVPTWVGESAREALKELRAQAPLSEAETAVLRQKLLQQLASDDVGLRRAACYESAEVGGLELVPALIGTLADYPYIQYNEPEDLFQSSRKGAAYALGKLADPSSVPALLEALTWEIEDEYISGFEAYGTSIQAGLEEAGTEFARSVLAQAKQTQTTRTTLQERLRQRIPDLVSLLHRKKIHHGRRMEACLALAMTGAPEVGPHLLAASEDRNLELRKVAAYAIGRIGDRAAMSRLGQMSEEVAHMQERYQGPLGMTVDQSYTVSALRETVDQALARLTGHPPDAGQS